MALDFKITDNQISVSGLNIDIPIPPNLDEQGKKIISFAAGLFKDFIKDIDERKISITENIKEISRNFWRNIIINAQEIKQEKVKLIFELTFSTVLEPVSNSIVKTVINTYNENTGNREMWAGIISKNTANYLFNKLDNTESLLESAFNAFRTKSKTPQDLFEYNLNIVLRDIMLIDNYKSFSNNEIQDSISRCLYNYFKTFAFFHGDKSKNKDITGLENLRNIEKDIAKELTQIKILSEEVKCEIIQKYKITYFGLSESKENNQIQSEKSIAIIDQIKIGKDTDENGENQNLEIDDSLFFECSESFEKDENQMEKNLGIINQIKVEKDTDENWENQNFEIDQKKIDENPVEYKLVDQGKFISKESDSEVNDPNLEMHQNEVNESIVNQKSTDSDLVEQAINYTVQQKFKEAMICYSQIINVTKFINDSKTVTLTIWGNHCEESYKYNSALQKYNSILNIDSQNSEAKERIKSVIKKQTKQKGTKAFKKILWNKFSINGVKKTVTSFVKGGSTALNFTQHTTSLELLALTTGNPYIAGAGCTSLLLTKIFIPITAGVTKVTYDSCKEISKEDLKAIYKGIKSTDTVENGVNASKKFLNKITNVFKKKTTEMIKKDKN